MIPDHGNVPVVIDKLTIRVLTGVKRPTFFLTIALEVGLAHMMLWVRT